MAVPESAAGVSGTAHLGALADHLDVDAVDLLAVNTGHGLTLDDRGEITVPDRPGSGYIPDPAALGWRVVALSRLNRFVVAIMRMMAASPFSS